MKLWEAIKLTLNDPGLKIRQSNWPHELYFYYDEEKGDFFDQTGLDAGIGQNDPDEDNWELYYAFEDKTGEYLISDLEEHVLLTDTVGSEIPSDQQIMNNKIYNCLKFLMKKQGEK